MEKAIAASTTQSRARSIVFVAIAIALTAACAMVTIPLGPIPFTLQNFAISFIVLTLKPKEAVAAIAGYLLLGAIGLPVFAGFSGGIAKLAGPTGGFLWGYLVGGIAAVGILVAGRKLRGNREAVAKSARWQQVLLSAGWEMAAMLALICIIDVCGCLQYMTLYQVDFLAAFLVCAAPFLVVDICKAIAAIVCAQAVRAALPTK